MQRRIVVSCRRFGTTYPLEGGIVRLSQNFGKKLQFYAARNHTGVKFYIYCVWGYSTILRTFQNPVTLHAHFNLQYSHPVEVENRATGVMWDDSCPKHSGHRAEHQQHTIVTGGVWGWQVGRSPQAPLLKGPCASGLRLSTNRGKNYE
jgi:hypothetical protein